MDQPAPSVAPQGNSGPKPSGNTLVDTKSFGVFDPKTIESIKWGAIGNAIAGLVGSFAGYYAGRMAAEAAAKRLASAYLGGAFGNLIGDTVANATAQYSYSMEALVRAVVMGAVYGAIGGWVLAKFFPLFLDWNRKFLGARLNTFFKLLFVPTLVVGVLMFLLSSPFAAFSGTGFTPWLVLIGGMVIGRGIYAMVMDKMVVKFYTM